jgi:hypothetical protein
LEKISEIRNRTSNYAMPEIIALLDKAKDLGYDLGPNSPLERLTLKQFDLLVHGVSDS